MKVTKLIQNIHLFSLKKSKIYIQAILCRAYARRALSGNSFWIYNILEDSMIHLRAKDIRTKHLRMFTNQFENAEPTF